MNFLEREDFIIQNDNQKWVAVFDSEGMINWTTKSLENPKLTKKNVIVILLEEVPHSYLLHLQKLLLQGGGKLNSSFMNENLIDEISLIVLKRYALAQFFLYVFYIFLFAIFLMMAFFIYNLVVIL